MIGHRSSRRSTFGGFTKGVAKGVKGFVWDGWYALGEHVSDRTIVPVTDLAFDLYSISTGSLSVTNFMESWSQRLKKDFPVLSGLGNWMLNDLPNSSGDLAKSPFVSLDGTGVSNFSQNMKAWDITH